MELLYPLRGYVKRVYRHGPYFSRLSRELENTIRLNLEAIRRYQTIRLQKMIHYCYDNVPYYTDLFNRIQLKHDTIQSVEDIKKIPLLDKQIVKDNFDKLIAKGFRRHLATPGYSSGTTGMPSRFLRDFDSINFEQACVWRSWREAGDAGKRRITVRGEVVVPVSRTQPPFWKHNPADNELVMSGYHLSRENSRAYIDKILEFQPEVLYTYPSTALVLAKFFRLHRIDYKLDAVFTSSESIEPAMRGFIEDTFQTRLYDWYGQAERVSAIAHCREGTYHMIEDYSLTELIPTEMIDTPGAHEVVGTHFHNRIMPLLRYQIKDYVVPDKNPCPCGSSFRPVKEIVGRVSEVLVTPEGYHIANVASLSLKELNMDKLIEVQYLQEKEGEVIVKVVSSGQLTDSEKQRLIESTKRHSSPTMGVQIQEVPTIERGPNGKLINMVNKTNTIRKLSQAQYLG